MSKNKVKLYATESAIYDDTGEWYTLDHVERAMFVEGHLTRREVLDPNRKRQFIEGNEYF